MSAFSDDNFNAIDWINNWFDDNRVNANIETMATNLVFNLQLYVQEVNNSLSESAQQMIHNVPKVVRETEELRSDAILLKEQMVSIKDKLDKMSLDSSKSMKTLIDIDLVKKRMHETCKALQEADNWTTLSSDVEEVFVSGDIGAIAKKLIGMQNSLEILIDVPDYEQRVQRLEELKDKLEEMLETAVVNSFVSQSSDSTHFYVKLFKDIKRLAKLKHYYRQCLKNQALNEWKRVISLDPEENVIDWMNAIYDFLLSLWHSQINFCSQVLFPNDFETTIEILSDIFVDIFSSFKPSLTECINEFIEKQKNPLEAINLLIEAKQFTYHFAKSIELSLSTGSSADKKCLNKPNVELLAQILYSPYRELIGKYVELENQSLTHHLETVKSIQQPSESLVKAFAFAKDVEKRCHQFSQLVAIPSLIPVIECYFFDYLSHFKAIGYEIRDKADTIENKSSLPDWSLFQMSLFTLQASGELVVQTELFQQQMFIGLIDLSKKLTPGLNASPFSRFNELLLNEENRRQLNDLIQVLIESDSSAIILEPVLDECKNVCSIAASIVIDIALSHIQNHLNDVSKLVSDSFKENTISCDEEDVHAFSLSPQEYITQIGQYLLTIPQHLEPFLLQDNIAFKVGLKYSDIKNYSTDMNVNDSNGTEYLLDCITQRTIDAFIEMIVKLSKMTAFARQQLITDICYLCDVLDDLGLTPGPDLQLVLKMLKASDEELATIVRNNNSMITKAMQKLLFK